MNQTRFVDRVAVVTGAASGLGRSVAMRLATEGATVAGVDIDEEGLEACRAEIDEIGATMSTHPADIRTRSACHAAIDRSAEQHGRLDILVNCAGISSAQHMTDVDQDYWDAIMAINVSGPFFMSQAAIPHLLATSGNIVNIASNAGLMGQAYTAAYCATKGAVVNLTRAMAMEFAKTPLRVNAVAPGGMETAMTRNFELPDDLDFDLMTPYIGYRGMVEPATVAALVAFVASDEAAAMHGAIVSADQGLTAG